MLSLRTSFESREVVSWCQGSGLNSRVQIGKNSKREVEEKGEGEKRKESEQGDNHQVSGS